MAINIFEFSDRDICHKRKMGYSLKEIHASFMAYEPLMDDLLALNHVVRICHENGLPFTPQQIKRVFNKIYLRELHGGKKDNWNFLKKWFGKKLFQFKTEKPHLSSKVPSTPPFFDKNASLLNEKRSNSLGGAISTTPHAEIPLKVPSTAGGSND